LPFRRGSTGKWSSGWNTSATNNIAQANSGPEWASFILSGAASLRTSVGTTRSSSWNDCRHANFDRLVARVVVEFFEQGNGTQVVLTHEGSLDEMFFKTVSQGSSESLDKLGEGMSATR